MALLLLRGSQSLFRLHKSRSADMRQGRRLGRNDRLIIWPKPLGLAEAAFCAHGALEAHSQGNGRAHGAIQH
jgi:hypothetical protein